MDFMIIRIIPNKFLKFTNNIYILYNLYTEQLQDYNFIVVACTVLQFKTVPWTQPITIVEAIKKYRFDIIIITIIPNL